MFSLNKQTPPPPPPEQNGFKLELKLSEAALIKLVRIVLPVMLSAAGAGLWAVQSTSSPSVGPADAVEIVPSEAPQAL